MKFFSAILFACLLSVPAHAYVDSAKGVVIRDTQGTISVSAYTTVVASLAKAVKGVTISNTSNSALIVALGAAGLEQDQLVIPGVNNASGGNTFYPIALSQGLRISIKALDSASAVGQQVFSFFYY